MTATIRFDGGCKPNPGKKYGSFQIIFDDCFCLQKNRFKLGFGTNNEAEFEALEAALNQTIKACIKAAVDPSRLAIEIFTDSTIVQNRVRYFGKAKVNRAKDPRGAAMEDMAAKCVGILIRLKSYSITWNERANNVSIFGH